MVFDASKPIKRKGQKAVVSSLESAMAEEAREVEALIAARDARGSGSLQQGSRPKDLEAVFDFRVNDRQLPSANSMFASRKAPGVGQAGGGPMVMRESRSSAVALVLPAADPRPASSPGPRPFQAARSWSGSSTGESNFKGAHRKLSEAALANSKGSLGALPMSAIQKQAIEKDRVTKDHDPEAAIESDSSDENDEFENSDEESAKTLDSTSSRKRVPMSLAQAAENERIDVERSDTRERLKQENTKTNSLNMIISDNSPAATRKKPIHPNTSYTDNPADMPRLDEDEDDPYEDIERDMTILRSSVTESPSRMFCTLQRADFTLIRDVAKRTRSYLVCVDLSPQAKYALEWTIGTVMRDGDSCRIVHAIEHDDKEEKSSLQLIEERSASLEDIFVDLRLFLNRTRLSVKFEVEVIHHQNPKHLITEIIDTMMPTMVIIGSRGRTNISGIMLGSFSNYIVNKSSVPVMVARKRLRRGSKKRRIVPPPTQASMFPNNTFSNVKKID